MKYDLPTSATRSNARARATPPRSSRRGRPRRPCSPRSGSRSRAPSSRSAARVGRPRSSRRSTPPGRPRHARRHRRGAGAGVPPGLGSYATKDDRLDARLAWTLLGTQAVKGVEVGDGFALAGRAAPRHTTRSSATTGLLQGDEPRRRDRGRHIERRGRRRAGGHEAAADAHAPAALGRPPTREPAQALVERSDVCAIEALAVVAEAASRSSWRAPRGTSSAATPSATSWRPIAATSSGSTGRRAEIQDGAAPLSELSRCDWAPR